MGDIVAYVKEVKHNVTIDDAKFKPRNLFEGAKSKTVKK
jgi:hypothetical protein